MSSCALWGHHSNINPKTSMISDDMYLVCLPSSGWEIMKGSFSEAKHYLKAAVIQRKVIKIILKLQRKQLMIITGEMVYIGKWDRGEVCVYLKKSEWRWGRSIHQFVRLWKFSPYREVRLCYLKDLKLQGSWTACAWDSFSGAYSKYLGRSTKQCKGLLKRKLIF